MSKGIELNSCPYCGGTELRIGYNAIAERYYVVCYCCMMRGPEKLVDEERAAKAWNELPRKVEMLPDIELDVLEALAKEATPGPWVSEEAFGGKHDKWAFIVKREGTEVSFDFGIAEMVGEERHEENAAYIAAVNPVVILSLIAEARRHRRRNHE